MSSPTSPSAASAASSPDAAARITDKERELAEQTQRLGNELMLERQLRVADAARRALEEDRGRFTVRLKIPTGKKIANPLGDEELEEFEEGKHETKTYTFHKITANDWALYLRKRAELNNETTKSIEQVDNAKVADLNNRIYEFLAIKYLGMKHDDYVRAEWDDVRLAVDACNHITEWQSQEVAVSNDGLSASIMSSVKQPSLPQRHQQQREQQQPTNEVTKIGFSSSPEQQEEDDTEDNRRDVIEEEEEQEEQKHQQQPSSSAKKKSGRSSSSSKKLYEYDY